MQNELCVSLRKQLTIVALNRWSWDDLQENRSELFYVARRDALCCCSLLPFASKVIVLSMREVAVRLMYYQKDRERASARQRASEGQTGENNQVSHLTIFPSRSLGHRRSYPPSSFQNVLHLPAFLWPISSYWVPFRQFRPRSPFWPFILSPSRATSSLCSIAPTSFSCPFTMWSQCDILGQLSCGSYRLWLQLSEWRICLIAQLSVPTDLPIISIPLWFLHRPFFFISGVKIVTSIRATPTPNHVIMSTNTFHH